MGALNSISMPLLFLFLISLSSYVAQSYRKELRPKNEVKQEIVIEEVTSIQPDRIDPSQCYPTLFAAKVRVFLYQGFLTDEECDHLTSLPESRKPETSATPMVME